MSTCETVILNGQDMTLVEAEKVSHGATIAISSSCKEPLQRARDFVDHLVTKATPVYGLNTGFGYYAQTTIDAKELKRLQVNILRSHACGYGPPLGVPETRLAMALRLNVLLKGLSGTRLAVCEQLCTFLNYGIHPVIPEYGSVGASGDLAPLAHLALPLIGEGVVNYKGEERPSAEVLDELNIRPLTLLEKEGLTLINGTQVMGGVGGVALIEAIKVLKNANKIAALSFEALEALPQALDLRIHRARNHPGQIWAAERMLEELEGSYLFKNKPFHKRIQDPYSLRCTPQIHGPTKDALDHVRDIVEREFNAATDNPLLFPLDESVLNGGNFHGQSLALAFDYAAIAIAELASVSERRLELLMNPHFSGLNAFLTKVPGLQSGYMATQYLSASLVNENKILSHPASTDSIPGNVGIEDHVSMGMTAARKFKKIVSSTATVLSIEMLAAAQAIDLRNVQKLGRGTQKTYDELRALVSFLDEDRIIANDVQQARQAFDELHKNISAEVYLIR